jgi:hypothetical protein
VLALGAGLAYVLTSGDDDGNGGGEETEAGNGDQNGTGDEEDAELQALRDLGCPVDVEQYGCLTGVSLAEDGNTFIVDYASNFEGGDVGDPFAFHYHVFVNPPVDPSQAGSQFCGDCVWHADGSPSPMTVGGGVDLAFAQANSAAQICMVVATGGEHESVPGTGNCLPLEL